METTERGVNFLWLFSFKVVLQEGEKSREMWLGFKESNRVYGRLRRLAGQELESGSAKQPEPEGPRSLREGRGKKGTVSFKRNSLNS